MTLWLRWSCVFIESLIELITGYGPGPSCPYATGMVWALLQRDDDWTPLFVVAAIV